MDGRTRPGVAARAPPRVAGVARVVVIGAGMGGMAVAARLAVKRHDVTVVEQSATYGGKLGTFERDGFVFDTGPSLLTIPAVYRDLFNKTGGPLEDAVDLVDLEPAFGYRFPDGIARRDARRRRRAVRRARSARRSAARPRRTGARSCAGRPTSGRSPAGRSSSRRSPAPATCCRLARNLADVRTVAPFTSLRGLAKQYLHDPRLRMLVDRYATYTGSDPRQAPAALATVPYVEQTFGAYHVGGGVRRLADALHERTLERGVAYRLRADVEEVLTDAARVTGVRLVDGEAPRRRRRGRQRRRHAPLPRPRARPARRRAAQAAAPRDAVAVGLRAAARRARPHAGAAAPQRVVPRGLRRRVRRHLRPRRRSRSTTRPSTCARPTTTRCAPTPTTSRGSSWSTRRATRPPASAARSTGRCPASRESYRDRVLDVMAVARVRRARPPAVVARSARRPTSSAAPARPAARSTARRATAPRAAFLRPANASPVPGLFLVGGSSHPGGGLPLVGMSAEIVANLIGRA